MKSHMKTMIGRLAWLAGVVFASGSLFAQAPTEPSDADEIRTYFELLRSDVSATKIRAINEVMKLTGPEAEKFWPVYRKYEKELAVVAERKLALIREFAPLHLSGRLDDRQAVDLAARWLKNTQERLDLWKKYH
jgi:Cu2+-containing amine oxidase